MDRRLDVISGDRRISKRYQFELAAHFHYLTPDGTAQSGQGVTVDLSRRSILVLADEPPPAGTLIELQIDWPFLLQNVCQLELMVKGRVLRISRRGIVVENRSYEFRTRGERSFAETGTGSRLSMTG